MDMQAPAPITGGQKLFASTGYLLAVLFVGTLPLWLVPLLSSLYLADYLGTLVNDLVADLLSPFGLIRAFADVVRSLNFAMLYFFNQLFIYYLLIPFGLGVFGVLAWRLVRYWTGTSKIGGPIEASHSSRWFVIAWGVTYFAAVGLFGWFIITEIIVILTTAAAQFPNNPLAAGVLNSGWLALIATLVVSVFVTKNWLLLLGAVLICTALVHGLAMLSVAIALRGAHRTYPGVALPVAPGGHFLTDATQGLIKLVGRRALEAAVDHRFHDLAQDMWDA